jgi:hypothetical protein
VTSVGIDAHAGAMPHTLRFGRVRSCLVAARSAVVSEKTYRTYRRALVGYWPKARASALTRFRVCHLLAASVSLACPRCLEWSLDRRPIGLIDSAQWRAAHGLANPPVA